MELGRTAVDPIIANCEIQHATDWYCHFRERTIGWQGKLYAMIRKLGHDPFLVTGDISTRTTLYTNLKSVTKRGRVLNHQVIKDAFYTSPPNYRFYNSVVFSTT